MAIKSKKNKGWLAWLCFFVGLNLVVSVFIMGFVVINQTYDLSYFVNLTQQNDVQEHDQFKWYMAEYADGALGAMINDSSRVDLDESAYTVQYDDGNVWRYSTANAVAVMDGEQGAQNGAAKIPTKAELLKLTTQWLDREGDNLKYYGIDAEGQVLTNSNKALLNPVGQVTLPEGYEYYIYFDGQKVSIKDGNGQVIDPRWKDSGYANTRLVDYFEDTVYLKAHPQLAQCQLVIAVNNVIEDNPYTYSPLYSLEREIILIKTVMSIWLGVMLFGLALLIIAWIKRQDKRNIDRLLASYSGKVWFEFKFIGIGFAVPLFLGMLASCFAYWYNFDEVLIYLISSCCLGWFLYVMLMDLMINKKRFFTHNGINGILRSMKVQDSHKPFQQKLLTRAYQLLIAEAILVTLSVIMIPTMIIPFFTVSLGIYLIYRYMIFYRRMVEDMGAVCDQIQRMKQGEMNHKIQMDQRSDLYFAAEALNGIQEGVVVATEEQIKSERTKIELVTNVSHDLKTPLTSIISYVDLLAKDEQLSETAQDYVRILGQKSERLKSLINDLFDLSKATSDSLDIHKEAIDLVKLLHQVGADLDEEMNQSGLQFKVNIPPDPIIIVSDGNRLHRVFENLIMNAVKYSLPQSRVFIDLVVEDQQAKVTLKNIANYEMDFDGETITQRFVRGDQARSSEGSGLGLAIAENYTQICGGQFQVIVDGDLFKVALTFPLQ